jgi:hypothetical protein
MKKVIFLLIVAICFCNCKQKKKGIEFEALNKAAFNAKPFQIPTDQMPESLKRTHDSCMGFSFDANAIFVQTLDRYFIGSIVNRQSLKTVNTLNDLGLTLPQLISNFNIISKPCFEKKNLAFPLKLILGEKFNLQFPGANEALHKEINDAISASGSTEMKTGSWMYLDMKDALSRILDTARDAKLLRYRDNLLDTSNMVLIAAESIADVSFVIYTQKDMSNSLQAFLKSKPFASRLDPQVSLQLFYLNSNKFQMTVNGFFPVFGEFMKAELK